LNLNILSNKPITNFNDKPTLVFIHGNSMGSNSFKHQVNSKLFYKYNIFNFDLPGHGDSVRLSSYKAQDILNILYEKLKKNKRIILIGHSLGGHLAIQLLTKLKEQCIGLFIFGCAPLKKPLNVEQAYIFNENSAKLFQNKIDDDSIVELAKSIYNKDDTNLKEIITLFETTDGKFRADIGKSLAEGVFEDEVDILKASKNKVVVVIGDNDKIINIPYLYSLDFLPLWKNKIHKILNAGHCPHLEAYRQFNDLLLEYIEDLK